VRIVPIQAENGSYEICISPGILEDLTPVTDKLNPWRGRKSAVVTDTRVAALYGPRVRKAMERIGIRYAQLPVPDGEGSKSHEQLLSLYNIFLGGVGLTRGDPVMALGGGVVGDLAGFAAATYQRGVPFIQMPTTLLAQVDSSVGGKVGVNLPRGKNMVGCFYQPSLVLIDPLALDTLDSRQLGAGMGEVIKYGCIADASLFHRLEEAGGWAGLLERRPNGGGCFPAELIARCCEIKADYVRRDPFDFGARMELNFGHTLGHALESLLGYGTLLHGAGVCIGMIAAARWGERIGLTPTGTAARIRSLLSRYGLQTDAPISQALTAPALCRSMMSDKKAESAESVRLVLLEDIGRAVVRSVPAKQLAKLIEHDFASEHA
jgi:3-dehydroquinate synthase